MAIQTMKHQTCSSKTLLSSYVRKVLLIFYRFFHSGKLSKERTRGKARVVEERFSVLAGRTLDGGNGTYLLL